MPGGTANQSSPEVCDAALVDENCDGSVNEGCPCAIGSPPISCGTFNTGICRLGTQSCVVDGTSPSGAKLTACTAIGPDPSEICDGLDNDCDGLTDEGFGLGTACDGIGECGAGVKECNAAKNGTICSTDIGGSKDQSKVEVCNGLDDNCNGFFDENGVCGLPPPAPPPPPPGTIPASIGTIDCTDTGASTKTVTITGTVSVGLMSSIPAASIINLALGMDAGNCWGLGDCFPVTVNPPAVDGTAFPILSVPFTRFTPRVRTATVAATWFDLRSWTITGTCKREGCGFCRVGETCISSSGCIVNGL
jgi:hypothetical protein